MVLGLGEFTKIMHFRIFKLVLGVIVGLGLSLILMMNLMYWRAGIMAEGVYTHITSQDITAATWVFETYQGKQVNLVSDPATQFILEGLAGVDSVGGAYMPLAKRQRLVQALTSGSAENLVNMTRMMVGGETEQLLVFSGRTAVWARMAEKDWSSYGYNVWSPVRMSVKDVEFGEEIKRVDGVTQVFANPSLIIFQI